MIAEKLDACYLEYVDSDFIVLMWTLFDIHVLNCKTDVLRVESYWSVNRQPLIV